MLRFIGPLFALLTLLAVPPAQAGGYQGAPTCTEFYDKWDVPGAPAGILAMAGFGREVMAAQDCVKQDNVAMACEHWKKLLPVMDRIGPPLDAQRGNIEDLIRQNSCN
jgi:hypothetical protein